MNIVLKLEGSPGGGGGSGGGGAAPAGGAIPGIPGLDAPAAAAPAAAGAPVVAVGNPADARITVSLTNIPWSRRSSTSPDSPT
ncbi:MAG: hypothetical protein WDN28_13610 [Chthoniobacter sp.]